MKLNHSYSLPGPDDTNNILKVMVLMFKFTDNIPKNALFHEGMLIDGSPWMNISIFIRLLIIVSAFSNSSNLFFLLELFCLLLLVSGRCLIFSWF